jgi:hypothetical protein
MTFNNAPWAVDGARSTAALARQAVYASGAKESGIVKPGDLKVLPLAVPGAGLRVTAGAATILNWYQTSPSEAYTVSNPSVHTVLSASMPAPVPAVSYYLVCVVVGDPEFNQSGHPFMPSDIAPEEAADFEYVRVVIVPCSAGTTKFEELGLDYPAYALARLEVPANTSTITDTMIVDLRTLSQVRQERMILTQNIDQGIDITSATYNVVTPQFSPVIAIPSWCTRLDVTAAINGISHLDPAVVGNIALQLGGVQGWTIYYEMEDTSSLGERVNFQLGWSLIIPDGWAGTSKQLGIVANRTGGGGSLQVYAGTSVIYDIQFTEQAK